MCNETSFRVQSWFAHLMTLSEGEVDDKTIKNDVVNVDRVLDK